MVPFIVAVFHCLFRRSLYNMQINWNKCWKNLWCWGKYLLVWGSFRSSHLRCSIKQLFLEILQNLQENICTRICFLIKLQVSLILSFFAMKNENREREKGIPLFQDLKVVKNVVFMLKKILPICRVFIEVS